MPDGDKIQKLYSNLIATGKVSPSEIGSFDVFYNNITDTTKTDKFYNNLIDKVGFTAEEIGSPDVFKQNIVSYLEERDESPYEDQDVLSPMLKGALHDVDNKIAEYEKDKSFQLGYGMALTDPRNAGAISPKNKQKIDEYGNLVSAKELLTKAQRYAEAPNDGNAIKAFWEGLKSPLIQDQITLGLNDLARSFDVLGVAKKAQAGQKLSDTESELLDAYTALQAAQKSSDPSLAYSIGGTVSEMVPYMAQFALGSGAGAAGRGAAKKATTSWLKKYLKDKSFKALGKNVGLANLGGKAVGYTAGAATQAPLLTSGYSDFAGRRSGEFEFDEMGNPKYVEGSAEGFGEAAWKSYAGAFAETFGERGGDVGQRILRGIGSNLMDRGIATGAVQQFKRAAAWNGPLWETVEEYLTGVVNAGLTGEYDEIKHMGTRDGFLNVFIPTVLMGGAFKIAEIPHSQAKAKAKVKFDKAQSEIEGIEDEDVRSQLQEVALMWDNPEQQAEAFSNLAAFMSEPELATALNYVKSKAQLDQIMAVEESDRRAKVQEAEARIQQIVSELTHKSGNVYAVDIPGTDQVGYVVSGDPFDVSLENPAMVKYYDESGQLQSKMVSKSQGKPMKVSPDGLAITLRSAEMEKLKAQQLREDGEALEELGVEMVEQEAKEQERQEINKVEALQKAHEEAWEVRMGDRVGYIRGAAQAKDRIEVQFYDNEDQAEVITSDQYDELEIIIPEDQDLSIEGQAEEVPNVSTPSTIIIGKKQFQVQEQEDGSTFIPFEDKDETKAIKDYVDTDNFDVVPVTEEVPIEGVPAFAKKKTETITRGVRIVPKVQNEEVLQGTDNVEITDSDVKAETKPEKKPDVQKPEASTEREQPAENEQEVEEKSIIEQESSDNLPITPEKEGTAQAEKQPDESPVAGDQASDLTGEGTEKQKTDETKEKATERQGSKKESGKTTEAKEAETQEVQPPDGVSDLDITYVDSETGKEIEEKEVLAEDKKTKPAKTSTPDEIKTEEGKVESNPSEAQKEAENYKKGHIKVHGMDVTIENAKGSTRSGTDTSGKKWSITMNNTYGYFKRSKGKDGDQIDVFLGDNLDSEKVFVVDQVDENGEFDEHKVMMGFNSAEEARENYLANYEKGWKGLGGITEVSLDKFKKWVDNGTRKRKAFAEYKENKPAAESDQFIGTKVFGDDKPKKKEKVIDLDKKKTRKGSKNPFISNEAKKQLEREPRTLEEAILQFFVGGNRILYDDFKQHTGFGERQRTGNVRGEKERRSYIWSYASREKGGIPLDVIHEYDAEIGRFFREDNMGAMDGTNAVMDVLMSHRTRSSMVTRLQEIEEAYIEDQFRAENFGYTPEQIAELEAIEAEMQQEYTPEEEEVINEAIVKLLSEDAENDRILDAEDITQLFLLEKPQFDEYYQEKIAKARTPEGSEEDGQKPPRSRQGDQQKTLKEKISDQQQVVDDLAEQYTEADNKHRRLKDKLENSPEYGRKGQSDIFGSVAGSDVLDFGQGDKDAKDAVNAAKKKADQLRQKLSEETIKLNKLKEILPNDQEIDFEQDDTPTELPETIEDQPQAQAEEAVEITNDLKDFGEKIGMARKDTAEKGVKRGSGKSNQMPSWKKKYRVFEQDNGKFELAVVSGRFFRTIKRDIDTKEEAEDLMAIAEVGTNHRVYRSRENDNEYSIFRRWSSGKLWEMKKGFKSEEEAKKYMATNPEEIINYKTPRIERPHLDNLERKGKDVRKGNVTPQQMMDTFGFRGGEFGNWLPNDERQSVLNMAWDAFMDLADVLGITPQSLSLGGRLAIGFGSRGRGLSNAAAHYEPERAVINLTRVKGAGSLAHEWFHAADNYFGMQNRQGRQPNTEGVVENITRQEDYMSFDYYRNKMRPELLESWRKVWDAMRYKTEQSEYDKGIWDKRVKGVELEIEGGLRGHRRHIAEERSYGRKKKPATTEQLKKYDTLVEKILKGDVGKEIFEKGKKKYGGTWMYERQKELFDLSKDVTGRTPSEYVLSYSMIRRMLDAREKVAKAKAGEQFEKKVGTTFYRDSKHMDESKASGYFALNHEMAARAFEAFVHDQLTESDRQNDYLVHSVGNAYYMFMYQAKPYPEGQERLDINDAFKKFFKTVEVKKNEEGLDIMYSKSGDVERATPPQSVIDEVFQRAKEEFGEIDSVEDAAYILPDGTLIDLRSGGYDHRNIGAAFYKEDENGEEVEIFDPNEYYTDRKWIGSPTPNMLAFMDMGAIRLMPETGGVDLRTRPTSAQIQQIKRLARIKDGYVILDMENEAGQTASAEYPRFTSPERIITDIRNFFNDGILPVVDDAVYIRSDPFYSPTEAAIQNLSQPKGTPDQMKAMLLKGGAKQAELDWMGWDEFVRDKKSVTKEELTDWAAQNKVQLEEVVKGGRPAQSLPSEIDFNWNEPVKDEWGNDVIKSENIPGIGRYSILIEREADGFGGEDVSYSVEWEDDNPTTGRVDGIDTVYSLEDAKNIAEEHAAHVNPFNDSGPKYSDYQLHGGENYKEWLLTMPQTEDRVEVNSVKEEVEFENRGYFIETDFNTTPPKTYAVKKGDKFKSSHFDEPNIVLHIRTNERTAPGDDIPATVSEEEYHKAKKAVDDKRSEFIEKYGEDWVNKVDTNPADFNEWERLVAERNRAAIYSVPKKTTKRVLFIEEIQSDWQQQGRKEGFKKEITNLPKGYTVQQRGGVYYFEDKDGNGIVNIDDATGFEDAKNKAIERLNSAPFGVPDMPFKKSDQIIGLALKRMVQHAAENGFDAVAWTTGEQQAERYDLSKQVDEISVFKNKNNTFRIGALTKAEGGVVEIADNVPIEKVQDYIGKDLAKKVEEDFKDPKVGQSDYFGQDLKVGGEGMKAFYDKMIPSTANKLFKKYGANVGQVDLSIPYTEGERQGFDDSYWSPQPGIEITPQLVEAATGGFPMFSKYIPQDTFVGDLLDGTKARRAIREKLLSGLNLDKRERKHEYIKKVMEHIQSKAPSAGKLHVLKNWRDLHNLVPPHVVDDVMEGGTSVLAFQYRGEVFILTDNWTPFEVQPDRIAEVWIHEMGIHAGLRAIFEDIGQFKLLMVKVFESIGEDKIFEAINLAYGRQKDSPQARRNYGHLLEQGAAGEAQLGEEYLAYIGQKVVRGEDLTPREQSWWKKLKSWVERELKKLFNFNIPITDGEIHEIIRRAIQSNFIKNDNTQREAQKNQGKNQRSVSSERTEGAQRKGSHQTADEALSFVGTLLNETDPTQTPEFKKWFGDSKVVDENGKPLVVYHGASVGDETSDFTVFDGLRGVGWFAENKYFTERYNTGVIPTYEVFLSIKNPFELKIDMNDPITLGEFEKIVGFDLDVSHAISKKDKNTPIDTYELVDDSLTSFQDQLYDLGYDGIRAYEDKEPTWLPFSPTQIKSATENRGTFDPDNPDITFTKGGIGMTEGPVKREAYKPSIDPVMSKLDNFISYAQDSARALKQLQRNIRKRGGKIPDFADVYEEQNRMFGKTKSQIDIFNEEHQDPIMKALKELKTYVTYEEVSEYLKAKHAPERDKWIEQKTKGKLTNGSGFPAEDWIDEEGNSRRGYKNVIFDFERQVPQNLLNKLHGEVRSATRFAVQKMHTSGLISKEQKENILKPGYKYYVPLRGWAFEDADDYFDYMNSDIGKGYNNPIKRALGRGSESDDPIPYILSMAHTAIAAGNKNEMKRHLLSLARINKDITPELIRFGKVYEVLEPTTMTYVETLTRPDQEMFDTKVEQFDDDGELIELPLARVKVDKTHYERASKRTGEQHEVVVFDKGEKYIVLVDAAVAHAVEGENMIDPGFVLNQAGKFTRWWSKLTTSQNPAFILPNMFRDFNFALKSEFVKNDAKSTVEFVKNYRLAHGAIMRHMTKKEGRTSKQRELDSLYRAFRENGGETGYVHLKDIDQFKKEIGRDIKQLNRDPRNPWKYIVGTIRAEQKLISNLAMWSENLARFAAFLTEYERSGSYSRAATAAKEASVNFNRRGRTSRIFGSLYAFFNARIQGATRYGHLWKKSWQKMSILSLMSMVNGMVVSYLLDSWFGGDDEDEEGVKKYDKFNPYLKENYTLFPIPGTDEAISIPNAHGFSIFHTLGKNVYEIATGRMDGKKALVRTFNSFYNNLLPVDVGGFINKEGQLRLRPLVPQFGLPAYDLAINENFAGNMIFKDPFTQALEGKTANSQMHFRNVNEVAKGLTDAMFKLSGGDPDVNASYKFVDGKKRNIPLDINPEWLEHLFEGYFSGKGKFYNDMIKTAIVPLGQASIKALRGESPLGEAVKAAYEDVTKNDIPVVQRFYRSAWGDPIRDEFWNQVDLGEEYNYLLNQYRKAGKLEEFRKLSGETQLRIQTEKVESIKKMVRLIDEKLRTENLTDQSRENLERQKRLLMQSIYKP